MRSLVIVNHPQDSNGVVMQAQQNDRRRKIFSITLLTLCACCISSSGGKIPFDPGIIIIRCTSAALPN